MSDEYPLLYEPIVLDQRPSPPRSRLYHLAPIGIRSPLTESFTSYLARLAQAHRVGTWILCREEVLPITKQAYMVTGTQGFGEEWARTLNSVGSQARRWVEALEQLTGRPDLTGLTLLPWQSVLSPKNLVRSERAWCPQCLQDWRAAGREVYEPLLWAVKCVSVCPIHEVPLELRCPHRGCGQRLPPFHAHLLPGRCCRCLRRLDHREDSRLSRRGQDQIVPDQAVQVAKAVGDLLAAAPMLQVLLERHPLAEALQTLCRSVTQGHVAALARLAGLAKAMVGNWIRGRTLPQLHSLVQFCDRLGTTPLELLKEGGRTPVLPQLRPAECSRPPRRGRRRRRTRFPAAAVRTALEAVLADHQSPAPSLPQVAAQLGRHCADLRHRFPELCRAIGAHYRQERTDQAMKRLEALRADVSRATRSLVQQGVYPNTYQVEGFLKKPGLFWDPRMRDAWRRALKELGVTQAGPTVDPDDPDVPSNLH